MERAEKDVFYAQSYEPKFGNLHFHTEHSDNMRSVETVVRRAKEEGYKGLAITDHDTITGWGEFRELCGQEGLEYILGAEFYGTAFGVSFHFTSYDFDPENHVSEPEKPGGRYYISVDYGTRNPFSAGLWQVTEGKAYRIREYYHDGRSPGQMLTDEQYCDELEKLAGNLPVALVVIDPSAASMIAALRRRGRFSVRKARNEVLPGIRLVASLLQAGILQIAPQCKDSIREFSLYRWADAGEKDMVVKENDHAMDDIRYFCATILRRQMKYQEG
jgi:hypothetical protein